ncbi:MAG: HipA domain-containing protein [Sediminibacterium sp.]|nr:HipA domain-containing protein [Sediminibacterium sp.]
MKCCGCYKEVKEGYCLACRKRMFGGARISPVLSFDPPSNINLLNFQAHSKRLSISGVQLKYSLQLINKVLELTDTGGQYIIKPIPPSKQFAHIESIPANEHLTMQIAAQVFKLPVASNVLIYFKDGTPAYLTKRFDVRSTGGKYQQEDFTQLSGRTSITHGEHYKYEGSYEDIGKLIQQFVPTAILASEQLFMQVVFNYVFSNGDAHFKNFSLIRNDEGAYQLSPAYDLLSSVIHSPGESDTALQLYAGDYDSAFYSKYGYYVRENFLELAQRLSILPQRAVRILNLFIQKREAVQQMIMHSFLNEEVKMIYLNNVEDRLGRIGIEYELELTNG